MGPSGISLGSLLLIIAIFLVLFGKDRLQRVISDLSKALNGFKKGLEQPEKETKDV